MAYSMSYGSMSYSGLLSLYTEQHEYETLLPVYLTHRTMMMTYLDLIDQIIHFG